MATSVDYVDHMSDVRCLPTTCELYIQELCGRIGKALSEEEIESQDLRYASVGVAWCFGGKHMAARGERVALLPRHPHHLAKPVATLAHALAGGKFCGGGDIGQDVPWG